MANFIIGVEIKALPKDHEAKFKWCYALHFRYGEVIDAEMTNNFCDSYVMNEKESMLFINMMDKQMGLKNTHGLLTYVIKNVETDETLTYKEFKGLYENF